MDGASLPNTHRGTLDYLKSLGLRVSSLIKVVHGAKACLDYYHHIASERSQLPFEIDGVVYKVNHFDEQVKLGYVTRAPRFAIAHKFPAEEASTMIEDVDLKYSTFKLPPWRFEAGTPHIAGAIGLGAALNYLEKIGMGKVRAHEKELLTLGMKRLAEIPGLSVLGPKDIRKRSGVISFVIQGIHPHDIGSFLNEEGIMIRVGDHCAKPLHKKFKIPASSRMSFYVYNDKEDVERAVNSLKKLVRLFNA